MQISNTEARKSLVSKLRELFSTQICTMKQYPKLLLYLTSHFHQGYSFCDTLDHPLAQIHLKVLLLLPSYPPSAGRIFPASAPRPHLYHCGGELSAPKDIIYSHTSSLPIQILQKNFLPENLLRLQKVEKDFFFSLRLFPLVLLLLLLPLFLLFPFSFFFFREGGS